MRTTSSRFGSPRISPTQLAAAMCAALTLLARPAGAQIAGTEDTDDPAVVGLVDERGAVFCTGTVISQHDVLTAAHCVAPGSPPLRALEVTLLGTSTLVSLDTTAVQIDVHAGFDPSTLARDVAVVRIARPVGIAPVPVRRTPIGEDDVGDVVRIVGFGASGPGDPAPTKRSGTSRIHALDGDTVRLSAAPALPCYADSGAPVLRAFGGVEQVVGVVSRGDAACTDYALAARVDADAAALAHGSAAGGDDVIGGCSTTGARPPWLLAAAVMAAIAVGRRRKASARTINPT